MPKSKHLTLSDRISIESALNDRSSFKAIGRSLGKDCTTISKEVRSHRIFVRTKNYGRNFNDCLLRIDCPQTGVCGRPDCKRRCSTCSHDCSKECTDYVKEICPLPDKPPYVCNGCTDKHKCTLERIFYRASDAQKEYEALRSESRSGIAIEENEQERLDAIISPLLKKGQSINHIFATHEDEIMLSRKTIYNYVGLNLFSARNLDMPRRVRFKPRRRSHSSRKIEKSCRIGRSYQDFEAFIEQNPDVALVEMDTVEGARGGKVLLTISFVGVRFLLAFIRDANTAASVLRVFNDLYEKLGHDVFTQLFPVILTDNGSEFSNPSAIEFAPDGQRRTRIFYCDPSSPYQKGALENNHEMIRRIISKGSPFDGFSQEDITLMVNHINSYTRNALGFKSPYQAFVFQYGEWAATTMDAVPVASDNIVLHPSLLK